MTWLFESPWQILIIGIVIEGILLAILSRTGQPKALLAMLVVGLFFGALILVERVVITESEAVIQTLTGAAAAAARNDVEEIFSYAAPQTESLRARVSAELKRFELKDVTLARKIVVETDLEQDPPTATATFWVRVQYVDRGGIQAHGQYPLHLEIRLVKHADRWLVSEIKPLNWEGLGGAKSPRP